MHSAALRNDAEVEELYGRARLAYANNDFETALDLFQKILQRIPDHVMANFHIGLIAHRTGNSDFGRKFFARAVDELRLLAFAHGGDREVWLALICAVAGSADDDAIAEAVRDARSLAGEDVGFLQDIGNQLVEYGQFERGIALFEEALAIDPNCPLLLKKFGRAMAKLGRHDEAVTYYEKVLERLPDDASTYDALGMVFNHSNLNADKAASAYRKAIEIDPNAVRYSQMADSLRLYGQFDAAVEALTEGIALCPPYELPMKCEMLQQLGCNLELAGRRADAEQKWLESLDLTRQFLATCPKTDVLAICREIRLLWRLDRRQEAIDRYTALKADAAGRAFTYSPDTYSQDMAGALTRLHEIVGGRDVFLLLHGPSAKVFADRIDAFGGRDICFMTGHSFEFFEEGPLREIGAKVELATVSNAMLMKAHGDQIEAFLARDAKNQLLTCRFCFDQAGQTNLSSQDFEARYQSKMLFFPPPNVSLLPVPHSPLAFPLCNTLSTMLPFLVLGRPRRVFLFGVDGVGRDAAGGGERYGTNNKHYRYAPADDHEERMLALNLLADTLTFGFAAELSLVGVSLMYNLPIPPIYTVSPDSHIDLFPRIDIDACIEMLRASDSG